MEFRIQTFQAPGSAGRERRDPDFSETSGAMPSRPARSHESSSRKRNSGNLIAQDRTRSASSATRFEIPARITDFPHTSQEKC